MDFLTNEAVNEIYTRFEKEFNELIDSLVITDKLWVAIPWVNFLIYLNEKPITEYKRHEFPNMNKREICLLKIRNIIASISNHIDNNYNKLFTTENMKIFREKVIDILYINFSEHYDNYYSRLSTNEDYLLYNRFFISFYKLLIGSNNIMSIIYRLQQMNKMELDTLLTNQSNFVDKLKGILEVKKYKWIRLQLKPF